jgi:hypothetical protein
LFPSGNITNLAKLDDGLAESPAAMVVDKTKNKKQFLAKIGGT